jgi:glutamyl-tRNA synthetase
MQENEEGDEELEELEKEIGEEIKGEIRAIAIKNALEYGKASAGAVIGKVLFKFPKLKERVKEVSKVVKGIVDEINAKGRDEIEKEAKEIKEEKEEKEKIEEGEIEEKILRKIKKHYLGYNTRFAPEPSGYLHLGHVKAAIFSYEIARKNGGKFILRFDDTNPLLAKQEYVDQIKKDLTWLGLDWDSESYTSDYLDVIYEKAYEMVKGGFAYLCECDKEMIKKNRRERKECPCREKPIIANVRDFERMLNGESLTLRLKGNMRSKNTALRDPILMRVIKKEHYRIKDRNVWPSYDFACPIVDSMERISHVLRSKEYELRDALYKKICKALKLEIPAIVSFSRVEVSNNTLSKREIRKLIEEEKLSFDDPRLMTIAGLRNRGIVPEAIKSLILSLGLTKREGTLDTERILAENRKFVDRIARRINFVKNPVELRIPIKKKITLRYHPDAELGQREIAVDGKVYVCTDDLVGCDVVRLKDFCTVKIKRTDGGFEGEILEEEIKRMKDVKKIQWVSEYREAVVRKPLDLLKDGKFNEDSLIYEKGLCEKYSPKEGEILQFIRYGFVKFDGEREGKLMFTYSC